ncbi:MAG: P-II family nitrogen regulator [Bacillota bacterium]|nr:P-II family nitrogen regulator [Bacillota bacterium]
MKKVEAIIKPEKFDEIKEALNHLDIKGMTIMQVLGFGNQKGQKKFYRGTEISLNLLPKIKIEIVINDNLVDEIVSVIAKTGKTGNIGDGKIFVSTIDNAVRIRTGESGDLAL